MCLRSFKIQLPPASPSLWLPRRVWVWWRERLGDAGGTGTSGTLSCVQSLFWAPTSLVTHPENSEDAITEDLQITDVRHQVSFPRYASHGLSFLLHSPSSMLLPPRYRLRHSSARPWRAFILSVLFLSPLLLVIMLHSGFHLHSGMDAGLWTWSFYNFLGREASVRKDLIMNTKLGMKINVWSEK